MFDMGLRLRALREQQGLSMPELASRIGVSKSTVQRHENNVQIPTADHIAKLALLYHVTADYLIGLEHRKSFLVENLTDKQETLIRELLDELSDKNHK